MEYAPFLTYAQQQGFQAEEKRGNAGLVMELQEGDRQLEIHAVQCGIGKVNAASAVSFLIADNARRWSATQASPARSPGCGEVTS